MPVSNVGNGGGIIQSLGIGSGIDIQSLVTQLVAAESAPVDNRLTRQATKVATNLSAMGTLQGALSAFQAAVVPLKDAKKFDVLTATSGDQDVFTASADNTAVAGSYQIEVTALAKSAQLVSKPYVSGAATVVGTGTLTVSVGANSMALNIGSNNTLAGIRDAINSNSGNPGLQATLIYGQDGARLVLTSTQTGAANTITLAASGGDGGLAQLAYAGGANLNYPVIQPGQDASVIIAGITHTNSSNTISGAIDGVTLNLKSATPGDTNTLTVASDQKSVLANLQQFVNGYNAMRSKFDTLSFYNSASQTAGPLLGDPLMNGVDSQMRQLSLSQVKSVAGNYNSLAAVGITSDTSGKLSLDTTKATAALNSNRSAVAQLFGATDGIAARLDSALTQLLGSSGSLSARNKSLADSQKSITDQQTTHQAVMATVQQRYLAQFNALDALMSQLKNTSTFLTQQLTSLSASLNSSGK
jgi:flagellar hook-associated protein 2